MTELSGRDLDGAIIEAQGYRTDIRFITRSPWNTEVLAYLKDNEWDLVPRFHDSIKSLNAATPKGLLISIHVSDDETAEVLIRPRTGTIEYFLARGKGESLELAWARALHAWFSREAQS